MKKKRSFNVAAALAGGLTVMLILVLGTIWLGRIAGNDSEKAVRSVSLLYLDELAGRREQVVANNLQNKIDTIRVAIDLLNENDLSSKAQLEVYQARMKRLYKLEKFAFVDTDGLIYTSTGTQDNVAEYIFDYRTIDRPEISIFNLRSPDKKVVIAVPVDLSFEGKNLRVCFMEIDMREMLAGVSMEAQENSATFCNIYTGEGVALRNTILGGLAVEDNLLEALKTADFEKGYSYEQVRDDFSGARSGVVSFTYRGIRETLSYRPVTGTDWLLTYLIRENVISGQIGSITSGILSRSLLQSLLTVGALLLMFVFIIAQIRKNSRLTLERETADAENRARQLELERRLALQEELLNEKQQKERQDRLITALASDYRSVYYLDLDKDSGVCYQADESAEQGFRTGDSFPYLASFAAYAERFIEQGYREDFLRFIQPDHIREALRTQRVIAFRYMVSREGCAAYEEIRFAGVRHPEDREDGLVHAVGACFVNVDAETRKTMEQSRTLKEALNAAEAANKAKTAFLSNMSHEIRTPMNAIIGLDSIALNDPDISPKTREHLEKIGTSAHHLLSIINDILDMSRIESGRMIIKNEEFSFSRMLEQVNTVISGQCGEKGLHYECRMKGQIDEYYVGDDMKLRQVMINILGNAVKFTPMGGSVGLVIEDAARMGGKATLRFTFTDTGIGMSADFLPHLFESFSQEDSSTTSRYGSTGLGMPITKNIVELMNGTIDVTSQKGVGTTFVVTVTLGLSDHPAAGDNENDLRPNEMDVLVIDDDPVACEHARMVLGQAGIECETAPSGEKGVELVRLSHARRKDYNLILVDWKMPQMDGVETTRQIRRIVGDDTPIIILTSYNWDEIEREARQAGVDTFVAKPLFAGTVMDEFREAFKKKNTAPIRKTADLKGKRILLAEDMPVNAEIILMLLSMREMEAELAENGRIAVEKFSSSEPGYYDAILMDMRMPEMDGLEAAEAIRGLDRPDAAAVPIIALTANAFDEDVQRSMQAGLNAHLSKPVDPQLLFETLESLI